MTPMSLSASSAVAGSIVGALASVISSYVLQTGVTHRDFLTRNVAERQALYSKFIRNAAHLYAKALTSRDPDLDATIRLYALISRMRLVATRPVIEAAEGAVRAIVSQFNQEDLSSQELQVIAQHPMKDPLAEFSTVCRRELRNLVTGSGRRRPLDF